MSGKQAPLLVALMLAAPAAPIVAQGNRPTKKTDVYGDPLAEGALVRMGTVQLRHGAARVAYSRDGKTITSWGQDFTVRTWDVATGKQVRLRRLQLPKE